jgi:hypothetical protein
MHLYVAGLLMPRLYVKPPVLYLAEASCISTISSYVVCVSLHIYRAVYLVYVSIYTVYPHRRERVCVLGGGADKVRERERERERRENIIHKHTHTQEMKRRLSRW